MEFQRRLRFVSLDELEESIGSAPAILDVSGRSTLLVRGPNFIPTGMSLANTFFISPMRARSMAVATTTGDVVAIRVMQWAMPQWWHRGAILVATSLPVHGNIVPTWASR